MRFGLLGTLEVVDDAGAPVDLGGAQPRTVLAVLLAAGGQLVTADALIGVLWGDEPPDSAAGTLQSYISRLRRSLEPQRAPRDPPQVLLWEPPGYRLRVDPQTFDLRRFEHLVETGRAQIARGELDDARRTLIDADRVWRGPALLEFVDHEFARGIATRLEEQRMAALEDRIETELRLGRHAVAIGELTELVGRYPLREALWGHLALALYRSGRQGEALRALDDARRTLRDELGVEPGRALRELEQRILDHDPALDAVPVAPTAPAGRETPRSSRLVGRRSEVEQLDAAFAESARGARFALVEGEPGIGKTRLVEALTADAADQGAAVVWGRCLEGDAAPALWPWIAALRALDELVPTDLDGGLEQMLSPTGGSAPAASRFELFDAVARSLRAASSTRRVVIALDDLQWADTTSLELLTFLAGRLGDEAVLVVGTVRELDVGRNDELVSALAAMTRHAGSRRLYLRGLDADDTGVLLQQATGLDVEPGVATAIHRRAEGNPFYATELARLLVQDASLADVEAIASTDIPAGVRDVVRRRLARLPDTTTSLLEIGAVIGRDIELGLLALAADRSLDECLDELEPAIVQRLLVMVPDHPTVLRFSHALVREVLVDGTTSLRRARLHLRVADAITSTYGEADDVAEILAEHLWAAASVGAGQRAADALERAAEVALRRVALQSAEDLLTRAMHLRHSAGSSPEAMEAELRVVARLNAVTRARTGFGSSASTYRRGQELARVLGRDDVLNEMLWVEWGDADTACDFARGARLAEYFRDLAKGSTDPFEQMLGLSVWGIQCWHEGRITESCRYLDDAAAIAKWYPVDGTLQWEAEQRMFASGFALHLHDLVGDIDDEIDARFEELTTRQPDRFSVSIILTQAISGAGARGQWERAERYGRRGLEANPDALFTFWGSALQMSLGNSLLHQGRVDEGWELFRTGRERYLLGGTRTVLGTHLSNAGMGLLRNGRVDEGAALIGDARREYERYGERWPLPVILLAEGELAHVRGDRASAVAKLAEAHAEATAQGSHAIARRVDERRIALKD